MLNAFVPPATPSFFHRVAKSVDLAQSLAVLSHTIANRG
jgi:hypothetical protein